MRIYIEYLNKYDNLPKVNIAVFGSNEKLRNSQNFNGEQYVNYSSFVHKVIINIWGIIGLIKTKLL